MESTGFFLLYEQQQQQQQQQMSIFDIFIFSAFLKKIGNSNVNFLLTFQRSVFLRMIRLVL